MPSRQPLPEADRSPVNVPWRELPHVPLTNGAVIAGVSRATLYKQAYAGRVTLKTLAGRVMIDVPSLIRFIESATPWQASNRGQAAREARTERRKVAATSW